MAGEPEMGWLIAALTYFSYGILIAIGHLRDFFANVTGISRYRPHKKPKAGYSILFKSWESFYTRRLFHRLQDCWNRPICSSPSSYIDVMERSSNDNNCTLTTTGKSKRCLNLGSYNYLGFADDWKKGCRDSVMKSLDAWPCSMTSSKMDLGYTVIHKELEETIADFLGKEEAVVFAMGYNTNTTAIPALMSQGSLIISDSLNHTSIVNGARSR